MYFFNTIKQGWHWVFSRFSGVSLTLTDIIKDNISASSKSDGIEISFDLEEVGTCWNICLIQNSLQFFLWEMTNKKPGICCSILFLRYWFSCPNLSLHIKKLWEIGMCCMLSSKYITYIIIFRISPKCKTLKGFLGHLVWIWVSYLLNASCLIPNRILHLDLCSF